MPGSEEAPPRRTHHTADLGPGMAGERVTVSGWVLAARSHGAISFLTVRDRRGSAQVVAKSGECPDGAREAASSLKPHSVVTATGTLRASPKAPAGVEVALESLHVHSRVEKTPPFDPMAKTVKNIDTRLELRAVDLRRGVLQDVFYARGAALGAVRDYLAGEEFLEVSTPKLISTATEGGASLFSIFYYHRRAFLAQSPQLYKEQLTMSFERVFEIAPIFRAEASRTPRHLSEAISIDLEEAFADQHGIMDRVEAIVRAAAAAVSSGASAGSAISVPEMPDRIPRRTYTEMVEELQAAGARTKWGEDLYPTELRRAGISGFYFVHGWPLGPKPFYVKASPDGRTSESFDLMFGDLEVSSGSTRISDRTELEARMAAKGMDTAAFDYHLRAFDYGMPPHAGCGIGLERLLMALTGIQDIKDATFYPRDVDRLTP